MDPLGYGAPTNGIPMPGVGTEPDPYADDPYAEPSDDLLGSLLDTIEDLEPRYPSWLYKRVRKVDPLSGEVTITKTLNPPKRPTKAQFESWATDDEALYTQLVERDRRMIQLYRLTHAGLFEDETISSEDVVDRFTSPEPKLQVNQLCTMIAGLDVKMQWPAKTKLEQGVAQQVRAAATYMLSEIDRQHRERGNYQFIYDTIYSAAVYGRICIYRGCDPDDPEFPLHVQMVDPSTVFPVWGDKGGLLRVTQTSSQTLGKVCDRFDPNGQKGLMAKLRKAKETEVDVTESGTLIDVSTRWHRFVSWEGIQILLSAHKYGSPPWRIETMPGEFTEAGMPASSGGLTRREIERGEEGTTGSRSQWDLAEKWQSFLSSAEATIRLDEAVMSLLLTQLELDTNPPQITETPYKELPSRVDLRPGAHTKRRVGEKTNPVQFPLRNNVVGAIAGKVGELIEKTLLPRNVFGVLEGQSASGFSENTLLAAAKVRIQTYIKVAENTVADLVADCLWLYHGFGWLYVDDPNGAWVIPGARVDPMNFDVPAMALQAFPQGSKSVELNPAEVKITRELFDIVPFRPIVRLHQIDWRELTSIANAVGILMDKGLWGRPRAMIETGVDDPIVETQQVIRDLMLANPKMLEMTFGPEQLLQAGDIESYLAVLQTIVLPQMVEQMGLNQPQAPVAVGGGQAEGVPGPGGRGSVQGVETVQGDSQAMVDGTGAGQPRINPDPSQTPGGPGGVM